MEQVVTHTESPVVLLKNGERASRILVTKVMDQLLELMTVTKNGALLLNELVMKCHDDEYECFDGCSWKLCELGLFDNDGKVKSSVRDIVLSSIIGHWPELGFSSPIMAD
jgi:hypothetical protein